MKKLDKDKEVQVAEFKQNIVMTLDKLAPLFNSSKRTAQRRLKELDTLRSYNKNGRYFTLHSLARFDDHGIWKHHDIFFSKYGNLKQTLINIIKNSCAGLDSSEIGNILGMVTRSFLSSFTKTEQIHREKIQGRYIYFFADNNYFEAQKQARLNAIAESESTIVADSVGILILVEYIKSHELDSKMISQSLEKQGVKLLEKTVQEFLVLHGIEKKTPGSKT